MLVQPTPTLSDDLRRGCEGLYQVAEEQTHVKQEEEKFPTGLPPCPEPGARNSRQSQSLAGQERFQTGKREKRKVVLFITRLILAPTSQIPRIIVFIYNES